MKNVSYALLVEEAGFNINKFIVDHDFEKKKRDVIFIFAKRQSKFIEAVENFLSPFITNREYSYDVYKIHDGVCQGPMRVILPHEAERGLQLSSFFKLNYFFKREIQYANLTASEIPKNPQTAPKKPAEVEEKSKDESSIHYDASSSSKTPLLTQYDKLRTIERSTKSKGYGSVEPDMHDDYLFNTLNRYEEEERKVKNK
jgi:hypothetical protein